MLFEVATYVIADQQHLQMQKQNIAILWTTTEGVICSLNKDAKLSEYYETELNSNCSTLQSKQNEQVN